MSPSPDPVKDAAAAQSARPLCKRFVGIRVIVSVEHALLDTNDWHYAAAGGRDGFQSEVSEQTFPLYPKNQNLEELSRDTVHRTASRLWMHTR